MSGETSQPRLPSEKELGTALERYILQAHEKDQDAASTFLTPRNIRNWLIQHFHLGSERALDSRKLFIKNTARDVVERFQAGEPPLYLLPTPVKPLSPVEERAASSKRIPSASPVKSSQSPALVATLDEDEDEEQIVRPQKSSRTSLRSPSKEQLKANMKKRALVLSDEDEMPDSDVSLDYDPDSVSEDEPAARRTKKSRKQTPQSPESSSKSLSSPPPLTTSKRKRDTPTASTSRASSKSQKAASSRKSLTVEEAQSSDDGLTSLAEDIDVKPARKRAARGRPSGRGRGTGRKATSTQIKGKTDRLSTLKKLCVSCGARKIWTIWFRSQGCEGDAETDPEIRQAQIDAVLGLLESIGAHEGMTAKQAAQLKEERELAKEVAEIQGVFEDDASDDDEAGANGHGGAGDASTSSRHYAPTARSVDGKRARKPSAMAMASAKYQDLVHRAKNGLDKTSAPIPEHANSSDYDEDEDSEVGGAPPVQKSKRTGGRKAPVLVDDDSQSSESDEGNGSAVSVYEISDDDDEEEYGPSGRRRRADYGRSRAKAETDFSSDDERFVVDDDEKLGYEKKRRTVSGGSGPKRNSGARLADSEEDEDEDEGVFRQGNRSDSEDDEHENHPHGEEEVALHLSTQIDDSRHKDKGEAPRRKKNAENFRNDLKSFAAALNS
ncbi:hypothetical protein OC845_005514 [Tilletia horrida]|nr:hypothetical protein OC845_005514 [Tilletia horrida]